MLFEKKFIITSEILDKCQKFADDSLFSNESKYAKRNQNNKKKILKDIRNGKIAEEGVYLLLSPVLSNISQPDHNIYDKKDKSWSPDLTSNDLSIAVKSQDIESAINYGESWTFQNRVGATYDVDKEIFGEQNDNKYVVFVALNVPKRIGEIKAVVKVSWLHNHNLFKEMKVQQLRNNKVAVYFSDLELYVEQLWQI